jgi:hypothetical protein
MEESDSGLAAKADKSGVSIGTLRKVYKRGVAAWNSGHRPGTTPQQWGMARVNSYITKGKGTYHGADKDLREAIQWTKPKNDEHNEVHTQLDAVKRGAEYPDHVHKMLKHLSNKSNFQGAMKNAKPMTITHKDTQPGGKHAEMSNTEATESKPKLGGLDQTKVRRVKKIFNNAMKHGKPMERPIVLHDTHTGHAHLLAGNTRLTHNTHYGSGSTVVHAITYDSSKMHEEVAKDKESGLPKKYVSGLSPSTAKARAAHWDKMDKLSDKDPAAYEPAPGDATAKTKESKHTKKYREMFGEACWTGYKRVGMKKKGDKMVPNCVPEEVELDEDKAQYRYTGGMHGEYHPTKKQPSRAAHKDAAKFHERESKTYSKALGEKGADKDYVNRAIDFHTNAASHHRNMASSMKEEVELGEMSKLSDTLAKIKHDFSTPPADHKDAKPSKPTPATKPKTGGGMPHYPDAAPGKRDLGDSVEMDGEQIDELSKRTLLNYGDAADEQESDIRYTLKRTEKSKHISAGAKDELRKLADRRKAGRKLAADKRGYYKGTSGNYKFTHGDAKVHATEETQKGKNVVPPPAGTIATTGGIQEEENENKPLGKVMRAGDGKKKFKVFVKNAKGNTVKVGFGDPNMEIKRDDPERRKNFRARHNCDTATDRTTPRYWSCRQWRSSAKVEA